ncbi:hypothetical protein E2C01_026765 [Portunus trituberculatus]|uniref:Uncharacterized protein n=1 Tax=Portunus trituberculatus TaxID=210409 RepID=A0A5B7EJP0_PORTR|nr:hypothetical protein [Portunus trituberculatus]
MMRRWRLFKLNGRLTTTTTTTPTTTSQGRTTRRLHIHRKRIKESKAGQDTSGQRTITFPDMILHSR